MRRTIVAIGAAAWLTSMALGAAPSVPTRSQTAVGDWPSFRGPQRTAVSSETGLLQEWPSSGPKLVWETNGAGRGYGSLAIGGGRILTLGDAPSTAADEDEYLVAFDQRTGKPQWKLKTGPAWTSGSPSWQSSRSTPTIDGPMSFVLTAFGDVIACDTATGKQRWRRQMKSDFGGTKGDNWGYSESVLVDGQRLVCTPGGTTATMVALDKRTGRPLWRTVREGDRGAGHASIVAADIGKTRVYVQTTASGALGVRATDGKLLWSYEIDPTIAVIPTPIVRGDLVFFAAGYGRGGALLRQVPRPGGDVTVEEVYPIKRELANKHGGIVLVGDYLFGDSDDQGIPWCAEFLSGEIKWKSRGSGRGSASMAAADGRLYIHFADGTMTLAKASPDGYSETGSFKVPGSGDRPSWSHPVILGGRLFIREQDKLLCYDVQAGK